MVWLLWKVWIKMLEWCLCEYEISILEEIVWIEILYIDDTCIDQVISTYNAWTFLASHSKKRSLCSNSLEKLVHCLCLWSNGSEALNHLDCLACCLRRKKWEKSQSTFLSIHRNSEVASVARSEYDTSTSTHWRPTVTHTSITCSLLLEEFLGWSADLTTMLGVCNCDTTICLLKYEKTMDESHVRSYTEMRSLEIDCSLLFSESVVERSFHRVEFRARE